MTRDRFSLLLLFVALACAACLMPAQSDTWWQLRAGEDIWQSGRIALTDQFSHTVAGRRWPNHEWLSQAIFYGVWRLGGMALLTALCGAAVLGAWAVIAQMTRGPMLLRVFLVGAGAMCSAPAWSLRPQTFTLALLAITLWIVVRDRFLWLLPPLFLIWANLHGGVVLGGLVVFAGFVARAIHTRAVPWSFGAIGVLCLAATAITPLGVTLWTEVPQSLARLHAYGVLEWRAPQLTMVADLPFWLFAAASIGLAIRNRRRLASLPALTLVSATILLLCVALRTARNIPPFLLCAVPTIAMLLDAREPTPSHRRWIHAPALGLVSAFVALFVFAAWTQPLPRLRWHPVTTSLARAVDGCHGPLYNRYDEGGYLIWFMKDRKVFLDSRQDPYPSQLVLEHIELERTGDYAPLFSRYRIACALTPSGSPLAQRLQHDGWRANEAGDGWTVYSR
jgi:hypothetical protein